MNPVVFFPDYLQNKIVHETSERKLITLRDPLARRNGVAAARFAIRWAGLLFLFVFFGALPGASWETQQAVAAEPISQEIAIEAKDGLLTATFSDRTDDSVLRAAIPGLVAKGVQSIVLRGTPVHDIQLLARFPGLRALDIGGTQVRDLAPLEGLTGLQTLNLQFLRVGDLRPLASIASLRTLNLGGTEVSDLTPLGRLTELSELSLAVTKVKDLAPLAPLGGLRSLDLSSTRVRDLRPLAGMTRLRFLNLNGTSVDDIQPLAGLMALHTLDLGGTRVAEVRALAGLRELRSLNLESTQVSDVTPLVSLPLLHSVAVGGSLVRGVTPLTYLAAATAAGANQAEPDPVLVWNDQANRAIQATRTDAFVASRALALESIAVLDTIKSIDGAGAFLLRLPAPHDISVNVAVASAAHAVLTHLFPSQHAMLDRTLAAALAREPGGPARARAIAFGRAMADMVVMVRDEDGSMTPRARLGDTDYGAVTAGEWRPTSPVFLPPAHPEWATMQPFGLTGPGQFRPAGPPALQSAAFRQARADVAALGAAQSTTRTAEQTEIAHYWSDAIGTYAPAGHWNAIAANIAGPLRLGIAVEAELFAELNIAIADAGIAMADAKYTHRMWRPISAIREGDDAEPPIPGWTPLLETPNHPGYISGHSTFSGAAATVLTAWFGTRPFTFSSANVPGVTRHFASFQKAADEAAASRVYGGIHFGFDNVDGLATGRSVGAWTMAMFGRVAEDRGPILMMMDPAMTMANKDPNEVIGCALDNIAPLNSVSVELDGDGDPFSVAVDGQGLFTLPRDRLGASRPRMAVLTAISASGRKNVLRVAIN